MAKRAIVAAIACVMSAAASPVGAQSIHGRVIDERGAPVPRAEVQVLPSGNPSFTDASGSFDLGALSKGAYRVRVRRVGFELTVARVVVPLRDSSLVIVLLHSALALDTIHTTALEQQLPRLFDRIRKHLGAALYGPALDSMFARGGSRDLTDMMTVDAAFASIVRRPFCGGTVVLVDDVLIPGTLETDMGMAGRTSKIKSLVSMGQKSVPPNPFPANPELYISQKDIAAIEVFDSPDGVHEPAIDADRFTFVPGSCMRIVLIWSKYYQQHKWAGH
jgi:hypothetical protein